MRVGEATMRTPHRAQWVATGSILRASLSHGLHCLLCGSISLLQYLPVCPEELVCARTAHFVLAARNPDKAEALLQQAYGPRGYVFVSAFFPWPLCLSGTCSINQVEGQPTFQAASKPSRERAEVQINPPVTDTALSVLRASGHHKAGPLGE